MRQDSILEISIDENGRLQIRPEKEKFGLIYRSATEVHWDSKGLFLYSPRPREWTYLDWYKQIVSTIWTEYSCKLNLKNETSWTLIPKELKQSIIDFENTNWQEELERRN